MLRFFQKIIAAATTTTHLRPYGRKEMKRMENKDEKKKHKIISRAEMRKKKINRLLTSSAPPATLRQAVSMRIANDDEAPAVIFHIWSL